MKTMFVLCVVSVAAGCFDERPQAEAAARAYAREMHPGATSVQVRCMRYDADQNGYVSCDLVVDGHGIPLECAASAGCPAFCNAGCKLRQVLPQVGQ